MPDETVLRELIERWRGEAEDYEGSHYTQEHGRVLGKKEAADELENELPGDEDGGRDA